MFMSDLRKEQQELLQRYQLAPRSLRQWGQHFLCSETVLDQIMSAAAIDSGEVVLEIGPGLGVLTERLLRQASRVVLLEQDERWARILHDRFGLTRGRDLLIGDALRVDWSHVCGGEYVLVSNLPYSITLPVLERVANDPQLRRAVLLIQREVGERLLSQPDTSDRGALSVVMQEFFDMQIITRVKKTEFWPVPEVDGIVLTFTRRRSPLIPTTERHAFSAFVVELFRHRRKTIENNLVRLMGNKTQTQAVLSGLGISPAVRPQELTNEQWRQLYVRQVK